MNAAALIGEVNEALRAGQVERACGLSTELERLVKAGTIDPTGLNVELLARLGEARVLAIMERLRCMEALRDLVRLELYAPSRPETYPNWELTA